MFLFLLSGMCHRLDKKTLSSVMFDPHNCFVIPGIWYARQDCRKCRSSKVDGDCICNWRISLCKQFRFKCTQAGCFSGEKCTRKMKNVFVQLLSFANDIIFMGLMICDFNINASDSNFESFWIHNVPLETSRRHFSHNSEIFSQCFHQISIYLCDGIPTLFEMMCEMERRIEMTLVPTRPRLMKSNDQNIIARFHWRHFRNDLWVGRVPFNSMTRLLSLPMIFMAIVIFEQCSNHCHRFVFDKLWQRAALAGGVNGLRSHNAFYQFDTARNFMRHCHLTEVSSVSGRRSKNNFK